MGINAGDAVPFDANKLTANMFVGDVVAHPLLTAWIETARQRGCHTSTGLDRFASVRDLMTDFLLENHQAQK